MNHISWPIVYGQVKLRNSETMRNPVAFSIDKYKEHPSILKIKSTQNNNPIKFEFSEITQDQVAEQIKKLDAGKSSSGKVPINILKDYSNVLVPNLTTCFNPQ